VIYQPHAIPSITVQYHHVHLGEDCNIDAGVLLGYPSGRTVSDKVLHIGERARIRHGTILYGGTSIGAGLQTGHNVTIREENTIGDDFSIWNNSTVDYGCRIGSNVKIHTNVYVAQYTTIEDDAFLAPGVTIANDLHPGCAFAKECMRGPTIKRGAQIGCNVTILPYVTIGEGALVGAGSVVVRDVPARTVVVGNPAREVKSVEDLHCPTGRRVTCPPARSWLREEVMR
jgi:acetyltransferase-like isoleucine patch superfamily enzyme